MYSALEENLEMIRVQVAERLGWRSVEYSKDGYLIGYPAGRRVFAVVPSYVRDIKAAWTLVDYLSQYGVHTQVRAGTLGKDGRVCSVEMAYQDKLVSRTQGRTASLAICQAFLCVHGEVLACSRKQASI